MPKKTTQAAGIQSISRAALALAFFLLINVGGSRLMPQRQSDRFCSPNKSWIWWAVKDWQQRQPAPDLLLLGSSLMLSVVHDGDATYLGQTQDAVYHHRSVLLEDLIRKRCGLSLSSFSMAIGGQMASDAYAIVSTLFRPGDAPKLIVYGIAPRDFIDSMCIDPSSTETYRFMIHAGNFALLAKAGHDSFWNRLEAALSSHVYLFGRRFVFAEKSERILHRMVNQCLASRAVEPHLTIRSIIGMNPADDNEPSQWLANPYNPAVTPFRDNLPEYRQRYGLYKPRVYKTQIDFFEQFLSTCSSKGINICLVNMPLTPENLAILPPGLYARYVSDVKRLSASYGAQLVDFNEPGLFSHDLFADTVHVNGYGAKRFCQLLAARLGARSTIAGRPVVHN